MSEKKILTRHPQRKIGRSISRKKYEKILTRHPQRKSGKSISRKKYEQVRAAILAVLGRAQLTHTELMMRLHERLEKRFDGNPHWYGETVKLDLEARKVIERSDARPPKYRRVRSRRSTR